MAQRAPPTQLHQPEKGSGLSKLFQALINHSSFDSRLFREKVTANSDSRRTETKLHPLLSHLRFCCGQGLDEVTVRRLASVWWTHNYQQPFLNHAAIHEAATSPPLRLFCFEYGLSFGVDYPFTRVHSEDGVTVLDVVRYLCRFLSGPLPTSVLRSLSNTYGWAEEDVLPTVWELSQEEYGYRSYRNFYRMSAGLGVDGTQPLFAINWADTEDDDSAANSMTCPSLPDETWLTIFGFLDYFTLKKCTRVSKQFQAFAAHSTMDEELFRGKALPEDIKVTMTNLELHSVFDSLLPARDGNEPVLGHNRFTRLWFAHAKALGVTKEFATKPGLAIINIQVLDWPSVEIVNKSGVTVFEVLQGVYSFFEKTRRRHSTRSEIMLVDLFYKGFTRVEINSRGSLLLRLDSFRS